MLGPGTFLIGRYEILEKIGSGGMADVYKAKDHTLNRFVAVKVLKPEYSADETFVKKFRVEAQSAGCLSHPNIVNIYDVGDTGDIHFIVMELVQGITLKNYIDMKGKLDIKEALNISVQIASGLGAAHDNRIIHRDIKPQNVIMSRDGKVKVTDFGIAKVADSATVTTTAAGTVYYISPEQARGGYSDEKSDIYSLGITMFEMVTGRLPFEGESNVAVALMHIQNEMPSPREFEPSIPVSFEKIILKCTQKKPELRYASARDLIADLRRVLTNPDGDYVVIGPAVPAGGTIMMDDEDLSSLKKASLVGAGAAAGGNGADRPPVNDDSGGAGDFGAGKNDDDSFDPDSDDDDEDGGDDDEDEDEDVNPALNRVMMVLGIVGFIILAVIVFFIAANAFGLFSGGSGRNNDETEEETLEEIPLSETEESEAEMVTVPNLVGKTRTEIEIALIDTGLTVVYEEGVSESYDAGECYMQTPAAGRETEPGTEITAYISTGSDKVTFSSVVGMDYSRARTQLESMGFTTTVRYEYSSSVSADKVISTSPEAGTEVEKGSNITLTVSEGPEINNVKVPYVLNETRDSAVSALESLGLKVSVVESYSDTYAEGRVMEQSPAANATVEEGTYVTITISKGAKQTTYTATISIPNPFGTDIKITNSDGETEYVIFDEGTVKIVLTQDGVSTTIYSKYVSSSTLESSISYTSSSSSTGSATLYIDDYEFETWTVTFQ